MHINTNLKRIALGALICIFAAGVTAFIYAGFDWPRYLRVWTTAVLWMFNISVFIPVIRWIVSRISYERMPRLLFLLTHLMAGGVIASFWTGLAFLDLRINPDPDIIEYLNDMYPQYFNIGLFIYAALAGWLYMLVYQQKVRRQIVRESELKRLTQEAELRALKAQINPHFLFNALNSVNALVTVNPEGAREMNTRLGNMLRYVLDGSGDEFVTLRQELAFVGDYLGIESLRFGEKLNIEFSVDDELLDARIPPMTLETIVENAIKHGIAKHPAGGRIAIRVSAVDRRLECRVHDSGSGVRMAGQETMFDQGMGLRNTLERLRHSYGTACSLDVEPDAQSGCTVTMSIPLEGL